MATKYLCRAGQVSFKNFADCAIITAFIAGFSISYGMELLEFFKAFLDHRIVHAQDIPSNVFKRTDALCDLLYLEITVGIRAE